MNTGRGHYRWFLRWLPSKQFYYWLDRQAYYSHTLREYIGLVLLYAPYLALLLAAVVFVVLHIHISWH